MGVIEDSPGFVGGTRGCNFFNPDRKIRGYRIEDAPGAVHIRDPERFRHRLKSNAQKHVGETAGGRVWQHDFFIHGVFLTKGNCCVKSIITLRVPELCFLNLGVAQR
ncbi:hypothetical protein [Methylobacterium oryzihabitans]|uniref:Uncharacterized protein n=1 Tax=Methylobacterium oryzihabitans TaxID=2499852 RepID=A0A3S2VR39_9HYPH|nr:hypothetical protein [Methylobacterium oryzihabitans]RVU15210.1 hypothetical protein EOE48_20600 [Methylobacterium oryzihabitans]